MKENELSEKVIGLCIEIHNTLGPGLFESVYEEVLCYELQKNNIPFQRQVDIPVIYDNLKMDIGFRADIIVDNCLILELKSVENISAVHKKQVITYLKLTGLKLGLLLNFNENLFKDGITRLVNKL